MTFTVPAPGTWRAGKLLLSLSAGFLLTAGAFTTLLVAEAVVQGLEESAHWLFWLFLIPFWGAGIGMLVAAINRGRERAIIETVDHTLRITRTNLFGTERHEWPADELLSIAAAASGNSGSRREPVMQLQIQPRDGDPIRLMTGRDEMELDWFAAELRDALGLQERTSA